MTKTKISRGLLAVFFAIAGALHFMNPAFYLQIMPSYIPFPLAMIYISGVFEVLLGLMTLPERTRKLAGWGLIALLIAVFPANIHIALHPEIFPKVQPWVSWARLPFQGVFIFWVWKTTLTGR